MQVKKLNSNSFTFISIFEYCMESRTYIELMQFLQMISFTKLVEEYLAKYT